MMKPKKNKFAAFISSKGFYAAIAVCLAGAGIATWLAVDRTITGIEDQNSQILQSETNYREFPPLEEAAKPQENVPKRNSSAPAASRAPSKPPSSLPKPASSSAAPSAPSAASKPPEPQRQLVKPSYALPVKGDISNAFSQSELVRNMTLGDWRTHDGVDIMCEKGAEVIASAEGRVVEAFTDSLWGNTVTVEHPDGKQTVYSGLAGPLPVKAEDAVASRQVIGTVEGVPCESAEGVHLHFALKEGGQWADPLSLIARAD